LGGKFHLKLNIGGIPIANKYREGKMKRTLKRRLKVPEIAEKEPIGVSVVENVQVLHFLKSSFFQWFVREEV
jgi:protein-S-isoprenylcysteine O-methyltransferase Ste14